LITEGFTEGIVDARVGPLFGVFLREEEPEFASIFVQENLILFLALLGDETLPAGAGGIGVK